MSPTHSKKAEANVVGIFATIGAILIALGITWIFVSNWASFPTAVKILVLLGATGLSFGAATLLDIKGLEKTAQGVFLLTSLFWALSVFIIAQQFNYGLSLQENANLALVSVAGMVIITYSIGSKPSLILSTIAFYAWAMLQVASVEPSGFLTPQEAVLYTSLFVAVAYMALGWIHKDNKIGFGDGYMVMSIIAALITVALSQSVSAWSFLEGGRYNIDSIGPLGIALILAAAGLFYRSQKMMVPAGRYTWAAAAAVLYTTFTYTHQYAQSLISEDAARLVGLRGVVFVLAPLACAWYAISQVKKSKNITWFDMYAGVSIYAIYALSVILFPLVLGTRAGSGSDMYAARMASPIWSIPPTTIIQWLVFNVMFIALVLYIISFADREGRSGLLKTALFFFGLYLIARYVGFMTDLAGYLALSTLLIIGGMGLIVLSIVYHRLWKAKMRG